MRRKSLGIFKQNMSRQIIIVVITRRYYLVEHLENLIQNSF